MNDPRLASLEWPAYVAKFAPLAGGSAQKVAAKATDLPQREDSLLTAAFAGNDRVLSASIGLGGTEGARPMVERFHPHLERALAAFGEEDRLDSPHVQALLNFALIAECMGTPRPESFDSALLKPLVPVRKDFGDAQKRSIAFTALALGDTATALAIMNQKPRAFDAPVLRFEFNQLELIRYLAAVIDARRPADWIEPAWVEYFALFPMHLTAQAAFWPDLFNFARVLANVRGENVAKIADDIHARVQLAARSQA